MKKSFWIFSFFLIVQAPLSFAEQKCTIDQRVYGVENYNPYAANANGYLLLFRSGSGRMADNGFSLLNEPITDMTNSWQECYQAAVTLAQQSKYEVFYTTYYAVDGTIKDQRMRRVYVRWSFNDGTFKDSKGTVNHFSDLNQPGLGDQRGTNPANVD